MAGGFKRGGARGGGSKKQFTKKRSSPDDDDIPAGASKRVKNEEPSDDETAPFVPNLDEDEEHNSFVAIKPNGTRRVTISEFKKQTLISIREYYKDGDGNMKPGKKGIALTMEQYNNLLAAAPLLEEVLRGKEETVVRPDYNAKPATVVGDEEDEGADTVGVGKTDEEE